MRPVMNQYWVGSGPLTDLALQFRSLTLRSVSGCSAGFQSFVIDCHADRCSVQGRKDQRYLVASRTVR